MPTKDDELELEDENLEEDPASTEDDNTSEDNKPTPNTDWEKSYKGLQKVSVKKQQELQEQLDAQKKLVDELTEQVEGEKTGNTILVKQLAEAKEKLTEVTGSLESVNQEKATLDAKVERGSVIAKKFPKLAAMQDFIPPGENIEEFEKNAEEFQNSLDVYTSNYVEGTLEGASVPPPEDEEEVDDSEEDRLWATISATAGVSGKETEYQQAYDKWMKIQNAKST